METQALTKPNESSLVPADVSAGALQSALAGDLSRLDSAERLKFYGALCAFTGLNPLSKPFDWITFQGKLTLYANKGCAEQLRKIHGVSVDIIERKVEFGCLIVKARATDLDGRHDEAIAAVPWGEKMSGEPAAMAMMKAETKAKRRVTLSICGLSMLVERDDESEITRQKSEVDQAIDGAETVGARLTKLNTTLTGSQKETTVDIEVVPPISQEASTIREATPPVVETASPDQPGESQVAEIPKEIPPQPAALLPDSTVVELETLFAENKHCIGFLVFKGYLQKGAALNTMAADKAAHVLKNNRAFIRNVDTWARNQSTAAH